MKNLTQIILVSHDNEANNHIQNNIRQSGILVNVKIALNGGHALLYLNHLQLCNKTNDGIILVLLNMDTPVVDGVKFLAEYKQTRNLQKENICIMVIDDKLNEDKKSKALSLGISHFLSSPFCPIQFKSSINNFRFASEQETESELVTVPLKINTKALKSNYLLRQRYNYK